MGMCSLGRVWGSWGIGWFLAGLGSRESCTLAWGLGLGGRGLKGGAGLGSLWPRAFPLLLFQT